MKDLVVPTGKTITLDLQSNGIIRESSDFSVVDSGCVIKIETGAKLTITNTGVVKGGKTSVIENHGEFTLIRKTTQQVPEIDGVSVSDCVVDNQGKFTMIGGWIKYAAARGVNNKNEFNMNGGTISNSNVGVYNEGTFTMTGGIITDNTAHEYGGVYNASTGEFTMTGGTITDNKANDNGGGVYQGGTFKVSGNPSITGNEKGMGANNNVYLPDGKYITVTGALTGGRIDVTTANTPKTAPVTVAQGENSYTASESDRGYFHADNGNCFVQYDGSTKAVQL